MTISVSIVTATFNRADTLMRLYRSLTHQSASGFEWVVVDDGSSDNSKNLLNQLHAENREWIRVKSLPVNLGMNVARNVGSRMARGDWLLYVDSDDELCPDGLSVAQRYADEAHEDLCALAFQTVRLPEMTREGYFALHEEWETRPILHEDFLLKRNFDGVGADMLWLLRKRLFEEGYRFPTWLMGFGRFSFLRITREHPVLAVNHVIGNIHYDDPGVTHLCHERWKRDPRSQARAYEELMVRDREIWQAHPKRYARIAFSTAKLCYHARDVRRSLYWLVRAGCQYIHARHAATPAKQ